MWTISKNRSWAELEDRFEWVRDMKHVPQDPVHHAEGNVDVHTQMVLQALERDDAYRQLTAGQQEILWAAALLHDVEKRSTTIVEPDGRVTAHGHARKGAQTARLVLYRDEPAPFDIRESIVGLVKHHSLPIWLLEKPNPLKAAISASLEVNTEWLYLLARADAIGRTCPDTEDLIYRIECFAEFCREHGCWGTERSFPSEAARLHYLLKEDSYPDYVPFEAPKSRVTLMCGLPGSGKDSYIRKNLAHLQVISLDEMRKEFRIDATDKTGNGHVIQAAKERAREYLRRGQDFVWNATNTTSSMRAQLIDLFLNYRAEVHIVYIEVPFAKLHAQNRNREAIVPPAVLERLVTKLQVPSKTEAHRVDYHISNE